MRSITLLVLIAASFVSVSRAAVSQDDPPSNAAGFVLEALSEDDLDGIEYETGYRVGVLVKAVTPGSPAARAGFKKGDVLFTVGDQGVDSPRAVDRALSGKTGKVDIVAVRLSAEDEYDALQLSIELPAASVKKPPAGKTAGVKQEAGAEKKTGAAEAAEVEKIRAQLDALEQARKAGVLSDEEYALKKSKLEERLKTARKGPKPLDEKTKQQLDALEQARKAGVLSDEEYARKKKEILGDREDDQAPALIGRNEGKTYNHAVGFSFWYPSGWTVKDTEDFLQLIPPDPGSSPEGPTEFYLIGGESKNSRGTVDMARGRGVVLDWEGKSPEGKTILARVFVTIINNYGVTLVALGLKESVERRDPELRRMFASFGFGEGKRDPKLVGKWRLAAVRSITNTSPWETDWSRAQLVSESHSLLLLAADGTWQRHDKDQMLVGAGGVWVESNEESVSKGKWYADGKSLYMIWDDDSWQDYQYTLHLTGESRELRLVCGNRGEIWKESD